MSWTFGVIGGDQRQVKLVQLLLADGNPVYTFGLGADLPNQEVPLEKLAMADIIILPLPLCTEEGILNCEGAPLMVHELFQQLRSDQIVLAGQVKPQQWEQAHDCGIQLRDYFQQEELAVANAAATAEGAIQVAMERLDRTLLGMECLVMGFGRIGKLLSYRLHGLGAKVSVAARKPEDLAWIRAYGWQALNFSGLSESLHTFKTVFNTVPSLVLDEQMLFCLPKDCLCVDLASVHGIDSAAANRLEMPYIWARGLPGRMVSHTAAVAIRDTIYHMILGE